MEGKSVVFETEQPEPSTPFSPSLMSEVQGLLKDGAISTGQQEYKVEAEDLQGIIEAPFSLAAFATKYQGFGLTEKESLKLAKAVLKPIQRLYGANPNLDMGIAIGAFVSIAADKVAEYIIWKDTRTPLEDTVASDAPKESISINREEQRIPLMRGD
jgi:hypothetical protein